VEESILPRLYREAPLNSIWEGSGNVNALDVLRAMSREPESVAAFLAEVARAGPDARLDRAVEDLKRELSNPAEIESRARRVVERMALVLQGSLLVRYGDPVVADAFCASRLDGDWGHTFGTLPARMDLASVVERHRPVTYR
jgi:putative acyl-CoA dehydrogenase